MSSRIAIALVTSVVALAPIAGSTSAAGGVSVSAAANGSTDLVECLRGKRAADRSAVFRGEMRQIENGPAMRMRFELSERVGRGPWQPVAAPGLGVWRNARVGISRFAYRQRIASLQPATAYRVAVKFQWHDAAGMLVQRQVARSPVCRQGGSLPNVRVGGLERKPGPTPDTERYVVSVRNGGGAAAKRVEISLLVDGAEVDTRSSGRVAAHGRREIAFVGPACTGDVTVRLDPNGVLRELDERDNSRSFACNDVS